MVEVLDMPDGIFLNVNKITLKDVNKMVCCFILYANPHFMHLDAASVHLIARLILLILEYLVKRQLMTEVQEYLFNALLMKTN